MTILQNRLDLCVCHAIFLRQVFFKIYFLRVAERVGSRDAMCMPIKYRQVVRTCVHAEAKRFVRCGKCTTVG